MIIFFILVIFFFHSEINPQSNGIEYFFEALINDQKDLSQYLHPDDLKKSERLGISYEGVGNKFLISYDIDETVKEKIKKGELSYRVLYEPLEDGFIKATFKINGNNYSKDFYFKDEKLISPSSYFTRNWEVKESKYFRIFLSEPVLINDYSMQQLDNFVDSMLDLLNINESDIKLLEKEKINYFLCNDESEIEKVSGFNTRGIFILAYDEIITTYNCHFHEIAHLLINVKLKSAGSVPLYTLPFFQEGFATAVGGRGGLGRNVLLDIGSFLQKSKFIPFNSLLTKAEFFSEDASLTYPVSALYNLFLMTEYGIESYLKLYSNYSGDADYVSALQINSIKFPPAEKFYTYLENYKNQNGIALQVNENFKIIFESNAGIISESKNYYRVKMHSSLLFQTSNPLSNYKSKKFDEASPGIDYAGYKYLIKADTREVNINNLYTNILIASYSTGFTMDIKEVPKEENYFVFFVKKDVFEEDMKELIIPDL